jgi:membrane protein
MPRRKWNTRHWRALTRAYAARTVTLGGLSAGQLAVRVWRRIDKDDVFGRAAQLSYYFVLALFPLLIFLSTLVGYFFAAEQGLYHSLIQYLGRVMPRSAFELLRGTLDELTRGTGGGKLTIGLVLTLWTASAGMEALIEGLNVAYAVAEARPRWRRRLLAIGLTIALGGLVAMALFLIVASNAVAHAVGRFFPVFERIGRLSSVMQWSVGILLLLLALALVFRLAPNLGQPRWEGALPGAVVTVVCWIAASAGFRLYLSRFDSFNRTYGSLGAVVILLVWLYVSGAAILIGGELNSVIWQAVLHRRKKIEEVEA